MYTITIKKTPTTRLFDRMPMPRAKVRAISIPRNRLSKHATTPFQMKVNRIK